MKRNGKIHSNWLVLYSRIYVIYPENEKLKNNRKKKIKNFKSIGLFLYEFYIIYYKNDI